MDAVAQRPRFGRRPDPDRRVAPQRINQAAVRPGRKRCQNARPPDGFAVSTTTLSCCSAAGSAVSPSFGIRQLQARPRKSMLIRLDFRAGTS
jgi:hypothetical protein